MIKKTTLAIFAAAMGAAVLPAQAVLTTTFAESPRGFDDPVKVFTIYATGAETSVAGGNAGLPTTGNLLDGATGSFTWTWTAEDLFDANVFTGRVGKGWMYHQDGEAFGPSTISDEGINLIPGEAVRMKFDLSGLSLNSGSSLRLEYLDLRNQGTGLGVVSFVDQSEGTVTHLTGNGPDQIPVTDGEQMLGIIVDDGDEIILWRQALGGQVRLKGFRFSVAESMAEVKAVPKAQKAFASHSFPGRVEFEHFDFGGEMRAYHDATTGNKANSLSREGEDVDIYDRNETVVVNNVENGEWLEYTIDSIEQGMNTVAICYAKKSIDTTLVEISANGVPIGSVALKETGEWDRYETVVAEGVHFPAGRNVVLRFRMNGNCNLDWFEVSQTKPETLSFLLTSNGK